MPAYISQPIANQYLGPFHLYIYFQKKKEIRERIVTLYPYTNTKAAQLRANRRLIAPRAADAIAGLCTRVIHVSSRHPNHTHIHIHRRHADS